MPNDPQPTILEYRPARPGRLARDSDGLPEDAKATELARLALTAGTIAFLVSWVPLMPLIMAYLARDWGREARRRAVRQNTASRALVGMILGYIAVVPNLLLVLLLLLVAVVWHATG